MKDSPVDDPGKARMEKYPHRQVVAKRIDFMIDSQSAKSLAENPVYPPQIPFYPNKFPRRIMIAWTCFRKPRPTPSLHIASMTSR